MHEFRTLGDFFNEEERFDGGAGFADGDDPIDAATELPPGADALLSDIDCCRTTAEGFDAFTAEGFCCWGWGCVPLEAGFCFGFGGRGLAA